MSLTAANKGGDFKTVEPGTYSARCIRLLDLGTQHSEYQGKPIARHQALIMWELPTELIEGGDYDGKPYTVSKFYTVSLNEKATLRKDLESWRGRVFTEEELKGFDLRNILGKACMLSVVLNENKKIKVSGVMALPKGMTVPEQINESIEFDLDVFDKSVFEIIPDGIKNIIIESDEYKQMSGIPLENESTTTEIDDDIPF